VAPATGGPGTRPASNGRPSPRGPGPSPHARRCAAPHGGRRGHPARGGGSARDGTRPGGQHGIGCDLLSVNLTSIHVFEGLLRLLWRLKLHVGVAPGQVGLEPVHRHVNHLDLPVGGEDFLDVLLDDVPGQSPQVDLGGFRTGASATPLPLILLHGLGLGA